jgi:uncharacterized protein (TIGR02147 family)
MKALYWITKAETMKPIFSYIDYRTFLGDYYALKKKRTRYFSYRYFSNKAGLKSPVFLKLVIEGKRNLTDRSIEQFLQALELSEKEARFFRHLVRFNQAENASQKQEHYAVLLSMMGSVRERQLSRKEYEYLRTWYTPVVRELICLTDFGDDWSRLGALLIPPIGVREVKKAVRLLLDLGLVEKRESKTYVQTNAALSTSHEVAMLAIRDFNRQMLVRAEAAIDAVPRELRHISGITAGISGAGLAVLQTEIAAFKDRLVKIINQDDHSDRVYQINIQLFPLSQPVEQSSAERNGEQR